jgi:hypothetical protein
LGEKTVEIRPKLVRKWLGERLVGATLGITEIGVSSARHLSTVTGECKIESIVKITVEQYKSQEWFHMHRIAHSDLNSFIHEHTEELFAYKLTDVVKYPQPIEFAWRFGPQGFNSLANNSIYQ